MTVAIFASDLNLLEDVTLLLRREAADVSAVSIEPGIFNDKNLFKKFRKAVLIFSQHGVGELTERVYSILEGEQYLTLCIPRPATADRKFLLDCGASDIITPKTWDAIHVAERILAQLIFDREILTTAFGSLCGGTLVMRNLYVELNTVSNLSDPILVLGETGTGKELVAAEIHRISKRPDKLIAINCAELSMELSGSDLFGHQKGAFTGAVQARKGLFAEAGRGTIFLDEIGELDLQAQARLLRVLEDNKVRPVGSNQLQNIDARFILATNRNLEKECEIGKFRQDLYQRVKGFTLFLPPLRERKADIPILVNHFLDEFNREYGKNLEISNGALDCLFDSQWRGNIRELRSAVRKAAAYSRDGNLNVLQLQEIVSKNHLENFNLYNNTIEFDPKNDTWRDLIDRAQSAYFRAILAEAGQNKELAAKLSGLSRSQFYKKLEEIKAGHY